MLKYNCIIVTCHFGFFFPGKSLAEVGGSEFKEEVKKLSADHGTLQVATGECLFEETLTYLLTSWG